MNNTLKKFAVFAASLACVTLTACNSGGNDLADFESASKKLIYDQIAYPGVIGDFDLTQSIAGYNFKIKYTVKCNDEGNYLSITEDNLYCHVTAPREGETTKEYLTGVLTASFTKNDKEIGKKDYNVRVNKIGNTTKISDVHTFNGTKWSYEAGKTYTFLGKVSCSGGKETAPYSFWIDDGTGAFYAYKADTLVQPGWTVIVQCTLTTYYGQLESENYANVAVVSKVAEKVTPYEIDTTAKFDELSIDNYGSLYKFTAAKLKSGSISKAVKVGDDIKFVKRDGSYGEPSEQALNFTIAGKSISMEIPLGYVLNFFDDYDNFYNAFYDIYINYGYGTVCNLTAIYTLKAYATPTEHDKSCVSLYYGAGLALSKAA